MGKLRLEQRSYLLRRIERIISHYRYENSTRMASEYRESILKEGAEALRAAMDPDAKQAWDGFVSSVHALQAELISEHKIVEAARKEMKEKSKALIAAVSGRSGSDQPLSVSRLSREVVGEPMLIDAIRTLAPILQAEIPKEPEYRLAELRQRAEDAVFLGDDSTALKILDELEKNLQGLAKK